MSERVLMALLLAVAGAAAACGSGPAVAGGGDGGVADAAPGDAVQSDADPSSWWPSQDPNPDASVHGGPGFADGGAPDGQVTTSCSGKTGAAGGQLLTLTSGGVLRDAILHVPTGYDPTRGTMLVLNFHGFGSAAYQEEILTRMDDASEARGFIVAYPDGIASSWNAGFCCGDAWTGGVDDMQFVRDLLAELNARYCIDPRRVFATGMSNGAFFTYRLACEMADTFAAVSPVAGVEGLPPDQCNPSRPVPVLHFHGTADPIVPYDGGIPLLGWQMSGGIDFPSVADTMSIWRQKDQCYDAGATIYSKGDATCVEWTGAAPVILCTIDGGGHTWPGGVPIPTGKTSTDISATDTMLDFFDVHPMP